jgi:hypothetical protein
VSVRSRALAGAAALVVTSLVSSARAAQCDKLNEGRAAFEQGARLFEAGKPADAAPRFEEAFRLACKPAAIFNAALAWEAAGDALGAARAFDLALAVGLPDEKKRDAEVRLAALLAKVGTVDVRGPRGTRVTVGDQKGLDVPARVRVEPGTVRVYATFPDGASFEDHVAVAAGESRTVELAPPPPVVAPAQPNTPSFPSVPLGVTAFALSGALTAVTIGLGVSALSARDEFLLDRTDAELHDQAATLRTWTNVTLTGAIVFAVAGTAFLVIPAVVGDDEASPSVSVRVGPTALELGASF